MSNELPAGFGEVDPDFQREAYEEAQKIRTDSDGTVVFFKSGVTHCRFLPPTVDAPSWFRSYKEHGMRPDGKFATFTCPKSIDDSDCPICERGTELYDKKGEANIKAAKKLYAKPAYLYNAYIYNNPDGKSLKDGMFVLKSGVMVFKQLMDIDNDPAGDWGDISSLTNGINFRINRKGKGRFDTEYTATPVPTRTNIIDEVAAAGVEFGTPTVLTTVYPPKSYEELVDVLAKNVEEGD
jgi:hypothetical protein